MENIENLTKQDLLKETIKHIDIKKYDSTELIDAMRNMSFTSRARTLPLDRIDET